MKKKKLLVIGGILVILIGILFTYLRQNKEKTIDSNSPNVGINNIIKLENKLAKIMEDYYIVNTDTGYVTYDFENNILYKGNDKDYYTIENYIVDKERLLDKNGTILLENFSFWENCYTTDNIVLDKNFQEIYKIDKEHFNDYDIYVVGNTLVLSGYEYESYIIDLSTKEIIAQGLFLKTSFDNFIIWEKNNKFYVYNVLDNQVYENLELIQEGAADIYQNKDVTIYLVYDNIYIEDKKNNDFESYKGTCSNGYQVKDKNGKIIINDCIDSYYNFGSDLLIAFKDVSEFIVYLKDKGTKEFNNIYDIAKFVLKELDINNINNNYWNFLIQSSFITETNKGYILSISNNDKYLLDKNLKKVIDKSEDINCNEIFCYSRNKNHINIYYGNEIFTFDDILIELHNDFLAIRSLWFEDAYLLYFGNSNLIDAKNIEFTENIYNNIDVSEIISKYKLENLKDKIIENEELFKKYAYIVENNNDIHGYQKYLLDMFIVIIDNKEYLNEYYFWEKLSNLKLNDKANLEDGVAGKYYSSSNTIDIIPEELTARVIYHELMHFIDFTIDEPQEYDDFLLSTFITESGAELYTAKYFVKEVNAYHKATTLLTALEYVFGEDTIRKIFYSANSMNEFKDLVLKYGITEDDYFKGMEALNNITDVHYDYSEKDVFTSLDFIIDIFIKVLNKDWTKDKIFLMMLNEFYGYNYDSSKYKDELKANLFKDLEYTDFIDNLYIKLGEEYSNRSYPFSLLKLDDKMLISIDSYKNINEEGLLLIEYDFDNNKIINYEFIEKD